MQTSRPETKILSQNINLKVGVAMSGGVDSSVTAALLKQSGDEVRGFFMALAQPELDRQIDSVQKVAAYLGIPLEVIDLRSEFKRQVLDYFVESYCRGMTPNPCMVCNRTIKFGRLLDIAAGQGLDFLATGHYARIIETPAGPFSLLAGKDQAKDQSYFLSRLTQAQLARVRLPLGEYTKKKVRQIAKELGLVGLHTTESQDVCFLRDHDVPSFLARLSSCLPGPGEVVGVGGDSLGRHEGIHRYTIGQRRGLGISDATPYYVVGLNARQDRVIVGKKADLLRDTLVVRQVNWVAGQPPALPRQFTVKIRYRHRGAAAMVEAIQANPRAGQQLRIRFHEPQQAITPGQFAVFYQGEEVVGSGEICGPELDSQVKPPPSPCPSPARGEGTHLAGDRVVKEFPL